MYTIGDVARMSVKNEDLLYRMFGINAELLINHAWGWEHCTIFYKSRKMVSQDSNFRTLFANAFYLQIFADATSVL